MAFQVAEETAQLIGLREKKEIAGNNWYHSFMKRYPELSLRQPA
jgi:hypothetical protein